MSRPAYLRTYGDRAENATNPTAKLLLQTMERKKTNLAVSVDVSASIDFLSIIEAVGPYVCLIKASVSNRLAKTQFVLTIT
jgi:orotidine-5'-phosphate decarboxylase